MEKTASPRDPSPFFKSPLFPILFLLGCLIAALLTLSARAEEPEATVRQIIDLSAHTPADSFRFDPKIVRIEKGQTIRFLGSTGRHTVSSIKGMIPEGGRPFEIRGKPQMDLTFDAEGLYGIRCRVHGRHGMVMVVIVGDHMVNMSEAREALGKVNEAEREQFELLFGMISSGTD